MTEAPKAHRIQQYLTELLSTRTPSDKTVMMWRSLCCCSEKTTKRNEETPAL